MPGQFRKDRRRGGNTGKDHENDEARLEARAERTAVFGKTKLCKFFILGCCTKGKDCCFAHDQSEMKAIPDLQRTKICKTLINTGACNDPDCKYAHNKEEIREMPVASAQQVKAQADEKPKGYNSQQRVAPNSNMGKQGLPAQNDQAAASQALYFQMQMQQMMFSSPQFQMLMQQQEKAKTQPNAHQFQTPGMAASQLSLHNSLFQQPVQSSNKLDIEKNATIEGIKSHGETPCRKSDAQLGATECAACGNILMPHVKYCSKCGKPTESNYNVKNTFVEVEDPNLVEVRKSAFPKAQTDPSCLLKYEPESPINSPQVGLASEDGLLKASQHGLAGLVPTLSTPMHRVNTWASDLAKVDEEESPREDLDVHPAARAYEHIGASEKRLQDTPFSHIPTQQSELSGIQQQNGTDFSVDQMRVKNTFLEFETKLPQSGMRKVQTAAGGLVALSANDS
jgi:hypothetical protein